MAYVGIDLGTTNSAIAHLQNEPKIIENQGRSTTPSVVGCEGGDDVIVGQIAKDHAAMMSTVSSAKRHMGTDTKLKLGDRDYLPEDISAMVLKALKSVAEERLAEPVDGAVITIPAYFGGAAKEATKKAGELAGISNVRLLAEPVAAALAYKSNDIVLVYDLGGGTFDVSIIDCYDCTMLGLAGDNHLGGDDFDNCLLARLTKEVQDKFGVDLNSSSASKIKAKAECEKAKITLSQLKQARILFQDTIDGTPVNVELAITRDEFDAMTKELVDRTLAQIDIAIEKAHEKDSDFKKEDIQSVVLVGGSTYIPAVRNRIEEHFGMKPATDVNPDLAVAMGAAIYSGSGPTPEGQHRIQLKPVPLTTNKSECIIRGRTSPAAKVEARGGATTTSGVAAEDGKFSLTIELTSDSINDVAVIAINDAGEERKAGFQIRHDSNCQEEKKVENLGKQVRQILPRSLGLALTGNDNLHAVIIEAQKEIPCTVKSRDYSIGSSGANMPGICPIEIYEGDLPYSPLNTHMATLQLETAASPSTQEPIEISFQITEDHLLTVTARMVNFPDRKVTAKIDCKSASGDGLHVIEHADNLTKLGETLRPEEKIKINKAKQGLLDLCEQYKRSPEADCYQRIKEMGLQLQNDLERLEATYK